MGKYRSVSHTKEKLIMHLFFMIVIMSQGIREMLNNITKTSIFNYHLIPIGIILLMVFNKSNKLSIKSLILIFSIIGFIGIGFLSYRYSISQLIRTIIGFIIPLFILLINYKDIDIKYLLPKIIKNFNIFISIAFVIQVIMSIKEGRSGGLVGHPLTSGWYYGIFISLNCIYYKYFNYKKDIFIIKDIFIALIGSVLASGRISLTMVLILSLLYAVNCCKNKMIPYVIVPILIIGFLSTNIVDQYIWQKFRETVSWGDVTNGRLLGIREMRFFNIYPKFFIGKGVGYSNYISQYLFEVVNFENPIIMFSFDYGIITVIMLLIITFIKPIINFTRGRKFLLAINFTAIFIIPFTYNGLAETVGIFIVLIFIIYIFLIINEGLVKD
ncbi:hypothetical protein [Clostridium sp.]|uniref:hypothetical protein n=1 Tax=Clostridium sp. TaxID=1506 RepID=UPI0026050A38|nr:hypothetical protein [Clostridium sp.]